MSISVGGGLNPRPTVSVVFGHSGSVDLNANIYSISPAIINLLAHHSELYTTLEHAPLSCPDVNQFVSLRIVFIHFNFFANLI